MGKFYVCPGISCRGHDAPVTWRQEIALEED